jgi:2-dehydro-3-deoxygluconokinase
LGSRAGYVTRVGNDPFREYLLDSWQSEGLDISQVRLDDGYNGVYFVGHPEFSDKEFVYYRKKTAATKLSLEDIKEDYILSADVVYSTGVTQSLSLSAKEAVKTAFKIANEHNMSVAYDINFDARLWNIQDAKDALDEVDEYIDILFLSLEHDSERVLDIDSPDKCIKYFWDKGIKIVVVKSAKDKGYFVGFEGDIVFVKFYTENVVDATSSGDAFNGAFLHGLNSGMTPFEAAKLASIDAGLQCQGMGAIKSTPYKEQVYSVYYGA